MPYSPSTVGSLALMEEQAAHITRTVLFGLIKGVILAHKSLRCVLASTPIICGTAPIPATCMPLGPLSRRLGMFPDAGVKIEGVRGDLSLVRGEITKRFEI